MYGYYSIAVYNQERVKMARVRYMKITQEGERRRRRRPGGRPCRPWGKEEEHLIYFRLSLFEPTKLAGGRK